MDAPNDAAAFWIVANDRHGRAERSERREHHERIADRGQHYGARRTCSACRTPERSRGDTDARSENTTRD
jgi:hypothetical protein